ncbi:MAG: PQQ-binding-like beta-propeller repeat protein, partial [Planctomycetes bacterium]|nr:PQQ-binding-like beta-propeller repeat protein [Planctomycetota bacterium]
MQRAGIFAAFVCLWVVFGYGAVLKAEPTPADQAQAILDAAGVKGGLVVQIGCGDGTLSAALCANDSYIVHSLDPDTSNVALARANIRLADLYGRVSVDHWAKATLPYADNLVNLVVSENLGAITTGEVMRVLCPEGVAYIKVGETWVKTVKPRPDNIDEWTHFLHDASNNAVADDELVGPPRRMQWVSKPLWLRSHEIDSGISSVVTAKGRVFYIFDEGVIGITDERLPERWSLIARDAFNGVLLWKRPMNEWGWPQWKYDQLAGEDWTELRGQRGNIPRSLTRRLVADGDRVYVTLGYNAPLSILDAATGDVIRTVRGTEGADEILSSDGIVVVRIKDVTQDGAKRRGRPVEASFAAVDPKTGKVLWERPEASVQSLSPAIEGDRLFYYNRTNVVCLDLKTGADVWRRSSQPDKTMAKKATGRTSLGQSGTFVVSDGVVVLSGSNFIEAFDARTGDKLYRVNAPSEKGAASEDTYVIDGVIWRGISGVGYDIKTGEIAKEVSIENLHSEGHHHRCYRGKATPNYIMTAKEGIEFINIDGGENSRNNWLRGVCKYGIMPANGLLYVPSDQCFCEAGSKLLGFNAVSAAEVPKKQHLSKKANPTEKGPAYNKIVNSKLKIVNDAPWPTYRHDPQRSGATVTEVTTKLKQHWQAQFSG